MTNPEVTTPAAASAAASTAAPVAASAAAPASNASNQEFLDDRAQHAVRIKRKSLQARITHGITASCCILLVISGLFVFVPALTQLAGAEVVFFFRMMHRGVGAIFILVPLISAILSPRGVGHIVKNLFDKWDADDKKWMGLFMPYLFMAKHLHMPDQHEVKSGQRFADGMLWLSGILMAISGLAMVLGTSAFEMSAGTYAIFLLLHDIGFFLICIFGMAHIFLGAGIFQPYRGVIRIMWGDGTVSESDALYHWGHWARKEIASGEKLVVAEQEAAQK